MIDPNAITSVTAAFAAGLITSLHCVGMCGPFACVLQPKPGTGGSAMTRIISYHTARIIAYGLIGALLGAVGSLVLDAFSGSAASYFPWFLVLFFIVLAFRFDRLLPKPKFITRQVFRVGARFQKAPDWMSGGILGACTPFLPCGPLYLVFGLALVMGSPARGAEFLIAFGVGTLPLLFLAHTQYGRLRQKLSPLWMDRLQRGMALGMALMVAWRLSAGDPLDPLAVDCPLCPK